MPRGSGPKPGRSPAPKAARPPARPSARPSVRPSARPSARSPVQPHQGTNFFVSHGYLIGIVILVGALIVIVLIFKLYSRRQVTPEKPSRDAIQEKPIDYEEDEVDLYSQPPKLLDAKDSLELAKRASHKSESAFALAEEYLQVDTIAAESYEQPQTSRIEEDAEITRKEEMAEAAVELETSETISKEKKRRRSSVGETLKRLWRPKKSKVDTKSRERIPEGSSTADVPPAELSDTLSTKVESSEGMKSRTTSGTVKSLEDTSLTARQVKEGIDKISSQESLKDMSKDTIAKPSVKFPEHLEEISIEIIDSSETSTELVIAEVQESVQDETTPDTLREPETERRRSSLADAINWLWKQGTATEEEPKTLEDITEESDTEATRVEGTDSHETTEEPVEDLGEQLQEFVKAETLPDALPEAKLEKRRSSLADAINWLWKQGTATEEEPKTLEDITEESDTEATRVEGTDSHETTEEPVEDLGEQLQEFVKAETLPDALPEAKLEKRRSSLADAINWLWKQGTATEEEPKTLEDITEESDTEATRVEGTDSHETTEEPVEDLGEQLQEFVKAETLPDALPEAKLEKRRSSLADAIDWLWNQTKPTKDESRPLDVITEESDTDVTRPVERESPEIMKEPVEKFGENVEESVQVETATETATDTSTKPETEKRSIEDVYLAETTEGPVEGLPTQAETYLGALSETEIEGRNIEEIDSRESALEAAKVMTKESIQAETTADALVEKETESRRSSLADAINWLWNRATAAEEEPKPLEGVLEESFDSDVEAAEGVESTETTKEPAEDEGEQVQESVHVESLRDAFHELERSSSALTKEDRILFLADHERRENETAGPYKDIMQEPAQRNIHEKDVETLSQETLTKGRRASEPATSSRSTDITKSKRRRSSVGQALRKLWNPKKFQIESPLEEDSAMTSAQAGEISEGADNEPRDSKIHLESMKESRTDVVVESKVFEIGSRKISTDDGIIESGFLSGDLEHVSQRPSSVVKPEPPQIQDDSDRTSSQTILKGVSEDMPSLIHTVVRSSVKFQVDLEDAGIDKVESPETTLEFVKTEVQESVQDETTPDALPEPETERRRSTLADAINWLWKQGTATEEPKTLDIVEEESDTDATRTKEINSIEIMKEPLEDFEEQVQESIRPETTTGTLAELRTEAATTSDPISVAETEKRIQKIPDSRETSVERAEVQVQESIQAEATTNALVEQETERRRSSLADAIDWLWNRATATEEEPKPLEGVPEKGFHSDVEAAEGVESTETTKEPAEDEGEQVHESVQDGTMQDALHETVMSSSTLTTEDRITLLADHERREDETAGATEDIIQEPAKVDIYEQDIETLSQETLTKGRRASEPATSSRSTDITKTKRRRSSVGQTLRKLWNPKKFQIDSQLEEDSAMTSVQPGERSETVENEPHDSEIHLESAKDLLLESCTSDTEAESRRMSTVGRITDSRLWSKDARRASQRTSSISDPQQFVDDTNKIAFRVISKDLSEDRPVLTDADAKSSVKFLDGLKDTVELDIQDNVQDETTPDTLREPEAERRSSTLADAINWLWKQGMATEEEPKTLEDVTEMDAEVTKEVVSPETTKTLVGDDEGKIQECVSIETTANVLCEPETEDLLKSIIEPVDAEGQDDVHAETTPNALPERESERRRYSLADAIDWLWNQTTSAEEEPKTLEDVKEEPDMEVATTWKADSLESTKQPAEDEGEQVQDTKQAETSLNALPEPETSSYILSAPEKNTSLSDHGYRHSEATGVSENIIEQPAQGDRNEQDDETQAQEKLAKGRRASEPATTSRSTDITKTKRRRSSVGQALRKLWNPKKFQIESQLEEDSATTSAQAGEISESADIEEVSETEVEASLTMGSTVESTEGIRSRKISVTQPPCEDVSLIANEFDDEIDKTSSRGILKDISKDRPSLVDTVAKPSVKFQDDAGSITTENADSPEITIQAVEGFEAQSETTSDLSKAESERRRSSLADAINWLWKQGTATEEEPKTLEDITEETDAEATRVEGIDSHETMVEPVEDPGGQIQEELPVETPPVTLTESETERRRSSLADEINWLWNRTTPTEEDPKTLEDVTEEGPETDGAAVGELESTDTTKEYVEDLDTRVEEIVQAETSSHDLPEQEKSSSSHSTIERITSLPDHENQQRQLAGGLNIMYEPPKGDIKEEDSETHSEGKLTKGRRASEPPTTLRSADIKKTERRRSSVGQALRKLWNPKKFQISQSEEDSATTSAQPYRGFDSVENEPHDSEMHLGLVKESTTGVVLGESFTEISQQDTTLSTSQAGDVTEMTPSRGILKHIPEDTPSSHAVAKPSVRFLDYKLENTSIGKVESPETTVQLDGAEAEVRVGGEAETTSVAWRESETERQNVVKADSFETTTEPFKAETELQNSVQGETTPDGLTEPETERRRSSLADAIDWLWKQGTATEEEPKTLEDVTEEGPETDAVAFGEGGSTETTLESVETKVHESKQDDTTPVVLPEPETERRRSSLADAINWLWNRATAAEEEPKPLEGVPEEGFDSDVEAAEGVESTESTKEPPEDKEEQVKESVQVESLRDALTEPVASPSIHGTADSVTSSHDHDTSKISENIIQEPYQGDIDEQDVETLSQETLKKGRRASEPATSSRSTDITKTKRRRSTVGQALRKLWNPKKFQIESQLEEDSATTGAQPGKHPETVENEPRDSESTKESTLHMTLESIVSETKIESRRISTDGQIAWHPSSGDTRHASERGTNSETNSVIAAVESQGSSSEKDSNTIMLHEEASDNSDEMEEDSVATETAQNVSDDDPQSEPRGNEKK